MIEDVTVCDRASGPGREGGERGWRAARPSLGIFLMVAVAALLAGCRGSADRNRASATQAPAPPSEASPPSEPAQPATAQPAAIAPGIAVMAEGAGLTCEQQRFVSELPIAEASGAVLTELDGALTLMVIADSGHDGDYLLVDPESGAVRERGKLPMGGRGDDLEGLAVRGDRFYALTSSGWWRAWKRRPGSGAMAGFDLVAGPSPIGPLDAPPAEAMVCDIRRANCGRNFEGLCLAAATSGDSAPVRGECSGMALSKKEGRLYCVVEQDGALSIDPARSLSVSRGDVLADCNIDGDALWVGANLFGFNQVWKVTGWRRPERAQLAEIGRVGVGFGEGIAATGETLFRLSDTQGSPSLVAKFRCRPPAQ
jgi:hypothetical protein